MIIHLSPEIEAKLAAFAAVSGITESAIASKAILEFIEEMQDVRLAEERLAENNERVSLEDVCKNLGLED